MDGPLLVCCGLATLDVVQRVDRLPAPDEKVVAQGLDVSFGGPAANAAAASVALGVPAVLVTALGSGPVAGLVRDALLAAGVRVVDLAARAPGDPPVSTVLVTAGTGQRAVVSTNATLRPDDLGPVAARLAADVLGGATALLVDGHHLAAAVALAAAARRRGIRVLADGGSWKPGLDRLLAHVDVAILSADFVVPAAGPAAPAAGAGARLAGAPSASPMLPSPVTGRPTSDAIAPGSAAALREPDATPGAAVTPGATATLREPGATAPDSAAMRPEPGATAPDSAATLREPDVTPGAAAMHPEPDATPGSVAASRAPAGGDPEAPLAGLDVLEAVAALGPGFVAQSAGAGPVRVRLPSGASDEVTPLVVPPGEVVDTLGAGDVLHGAAGAALARGLDPMVALREGVAAATESVRYPGALGWTHSRP